MIAIANCPVSLGAFLRAEAATVQEWAARKSGGFAWFCVATIVVGAGMFGGAMGSWREPLQALYTGIKLPLAILLTTAGNGLLNGMLAPLLGLNVSFRQSLLAVLVSFAITSAVLGALSPVALFVVWNTPPLTRVTSLASPEYGFMQLTIALCIAAAGVVGNVRLLPVLTRWAANAETARRVLLAWLAGNLFLGSQICWLLRPFIWDPAGGVHFIGKEYLRGSFYETVFEAVRRMVFP